MAVQDFGKRPTVQGPLRVLMIVLNTPWKGGGTFYRALRFGGALADRGHAVTLLATAPSARWSFATEHRDGVEIVLSPSLLGGRLRRGWDPYEAVRRIAWLQGRRFDIVHGFESRPTVIYPALFAARARETALVLDWCDWFGRGGAIEERAALLRPVLRPFETFFEEHFRQRAAATTVINVPLRRRAEGLGVPPDSIMWLPNGADVHQIRPLEQRSAREGLGLDLEGEIVGHLGHAWPGDERLMRAAWDRLRAERPRATLLLIGNHKMTAFDDLIAAGRGEVLATGYVDQERFNQALSACDVHWIVQRDTVTNRGRFSMKFHDYLASGRPIVANAVGDLGDLLRDGPAVGLLAEEDPADIAAKTAALLADAGRRERLGQQARELAEREYAWELVAARLEGLYLELVRREQRPTGKAV